MPWPNCLNGRVSSRHFWDEYRVIRVDGVFLNYIYQHATYLFIYLFISDCKTTGNPDELEWYGLGVSEWSDGLISVAVSKVGIPCQKIFLNANNLSYFTDSKISACDIRLWSMLYSGLLLHITKVASSSFVHDIGISNNNNEIMNSFTYFVIAVCIDEILVSKSNSDVRRL